jgi:hypothetical protein
MTGMEVLDSALKIGLGAMISAISAFAMLIRSQRHDKEKDASSNLVRLREEKKTLYIEFLSQSQSLVQTYRDVPCDGKGQDYLGYLRIYNQLQISSEDGIRKCAYELLNAVNEFIVIYTEDRAFYNKLRDRVDIKIGEFQFLAKNELQEITPN